MKRYYLGLFLLPYLLSYFSPNPVIAQNSKEDELKASIEKVKIKKEAGTYLSAIARSQQAYFLEKSEFTTNFKDLGMSSGNNFIKDNIGDYQLELITDKSQKKSAIALLYPQNSGKTYLSLVRVDKTPVGEIITLNQICESVKAQKVVPKVPNTNLKGDSIKCPDGFNKYEFSDEEAAINKQIEDGKQLRNLAAVIFLLQHKYYSKNKSYARDIQQLFDSNISFNIRRFFEEEGVKLTFNPIGNIKQGTIAIISQPKEAYGTYLSINTFRGNSKELIICQSYLNPTITSQQIKNISLSQPKCPSRFTQVKLSPEEISAVISNINQLAESFQTYAGLISEIEKPENNSTLIEAEKLVKQGNHSQALHKYQKSLSSINIDFMDLIVAESDGESDPIIQTLSKALYKKINPILAKVEPQINQEYEKIVNQRSSFITQYQSPQNETADKLSKISREKFALSLIPTSNQNNASIIPKAKLKESQQRSDLIREYFKKLQNNPEKINEKLPKEISSYLTKNQRAIALLRTTLLNNEIPVWDIDYKFIETGDPSYPLPSFINLINLQNILLSDAIEKYQQGKNQDFVQSLEASWKISESLQKQPLLLSQLVSLISYRNNLQVIRQFDNLSSKWEKRLRLNSLNLSESTIQGLNSEAFFQFSFLTGYKIFPSKSAANKSRLLRRWIAVENYRLSEDIYSLVKSLNNSQRKNFCNVDIVKFAKNYLKQKGYSNNRLYDLSFVRQLDKPYHLQLEVEMTKNIIEMKGKNIKSASKSINSTICPDRKWVFKNLSNGKWSISLDKPPVWKSRLTTIPLTYTFKK